MTYIEKEEIIRRVGVHVHQLVLVVLWYIYPVASHTINHLPKLLRCVTKNLHHALASHFHLTQLSFYFCQQRTPEVTRSFH